MTISIEDICNRSILALGVIPLIESMSEGSPQANACVRVYDTTRQELLREARWNFAYAEAPMTLLASSPLVSGAPIVTQPIFWPFMPYNYEYAYPSDCLQFQRLLMGYGPGWSSPPQTTGGQTIAPRLPNPMIDWKEMTDNTITEGQNTKVICCNVTPIYGVYTRDITDPTQFDNGYQLGLVMRLAQKLALILGADNPSMKLRVAQDVVTMGEKAIIDAKRQDGNEGVKSMDHIPDFIRTRMRNGPWWGGQDYWRP